MRVWLATMLSFTVFVAYLDSVNVAILITFCHLSSKKWVYRTTLLDRNL